MNETPDNDWLDELLTEEPAYIDDAGFAAKVVQTLPVRQQSGLVRRFILGFASLVAVFFGSMALPQAHDFSTWARIVTNSMASSPMYTFGLIFAVGLTLLSVSVAWVAQEK